MFVQPDLKSLAVAADKLRWRSKVYNVDMCPECGSPKLTDYANDDVWCTDCGWNDAK